MMLERVKQITPNWAKVLLLQDVECFTIIVNCFETIEKFKIRIAENSQKIEIYKHFNGKMFYDAIDNLNKENRELSELLETLKEV